jgi:hypothetical protein
MDHGNDSSLRERWEPAPARRRLCFTLGDLGGDHNAIALQADLQIAFQAGQWIVAAEGTAAYGDTLVQAALAWLALRLGFAPRPAAAGEPPAAGEGENERGA